ncbi:MAG: LysR family transcriptional regulator [Rhodospirillaceae bacterium]|nr:LysR family transcriptional regulator [Rhodospirillaceae bacterium]MXW91557.1 LysR family transcriptional regulator [Rhodospirillaceae bacterium]MYB14052.1 LysR family transcriptional regulator [Rhodospirillaceae bacterium]MYI50867.1 LysR family transcriptional regulator [Rhodospirillaceae bacterium]
MPVTLRQLRYFQALVEHGSFSRAARNVHISQPALSIQIRELETTLGGPLVERESRGIVLTRLGRDAFEQTLRILDETLLLEALGKRFEDGPVRITVGILSTLAPYMLPGILQRLDGSSPRIELDIVEASGEKLVSDLLASRIDAAIVSIPLGLLELAERPLFVDRFLLAGSAGRLSSIARLPGGRVQPAEVARADLGPLLTLCQGDCLAAQVLGACRMWRIREVQRGAGSLATLSHLVANGAGLTLLPETSAAAEGAGSPDLRFLRFAPPEPSRHIGLAHRIAAQGQRWTDVLATAVTETGKALVSEAASAFGEAPPEIPTKADTLDAAA